MATCNECYGYEFCVASDPKEGCFPEGTNNVEELCEGFERVEESKNAAAECNVEDCAWAGKDPLMDLANEHTTLKIKAAGYDAIKKIVGEYMQYGDDECETLAIIDGVMRMEEAVTKALIK